MFCVFAGAQMYVVHVFAGAQMHEVHVFASDLMQLHSNLDMDAIGCWFPCRQNQKHSGVKGGCRLVVCNLRGCI